MSSKPDTCTQGADIDAAGLSVKVTQETVKGFKGQQKALFRESLGRNTGRFIKKDMVLVIRGWINYFRLAEVKGIFERLNQWIKHLLRCILWRQWKKPQARPPGQMCFGLCEEFAWRSAANGGGPCWNLG